MPKANLSRTLSVGLRDIRFHARHGVYAEEALLGGEYLVQVACRLRAEVHPTADRLADTLNYGSLYEICAEVFDERVQLIETLAYRICERIRETHADQVASVRIEIEKLHPPVGGRVGSSYVVWEEEL